MLGSLSVRQWRAIGWVVASLILAIILALAILQVQAPSQGIDKSTPAPSATTLLGSFLLFSLAAGAGSMAIIQLAKNILGVRAFYQEYKVKRWLAGRRGPIAKPAYDDLIRALGYCKTPENDKSPEAKLGQSEERALFNLPVEQLAAQISLAADLAVSYPSEYKNLLEALTGQPVEAATATGIEATNPPGSAGGNLPHSGKSEPSASPSASTVNVPTDTEIRRSYQVRSGMDGLQLYVGQGWRRTVRLNAVLISGLLGVVWVRFLNIYPSLSVAYILSGLILGGFISWFLRDLVAIVERLRS
jgi:hypothetical protein